MKSTLIIYSEIPEGDKYAIVPMEQEEYDKFKKCNGFCVGAHEQDTEKEDIVDEISHLLYKRTRKPRDNQEVRDYEGNWVEYSVDQIPDDTAFDCVIHCSFIL